jgi:putative ABC transport system permease protein
MVELLLSELRYAARSLRRSPGFTLVAILTLALGIGANTALFSIVYGILMRPLEYRDADRLVAITAERHFSGRPRPVAANFSLPDLAVYQARAHAFESLAMARSANAALAGESGIEIVSVAAVTSSFFSTIDGRFLLGRPIGPADDRSPVVVISRRLWQRRFADSAAIVGQQLVLDRQPYAIVGVVDQTFQWPGDRTDIWSPVEFARTLNPLIGRDRAGGFVAIARLGPGASLAQARAESEVVAQALDPNLHATAVPLREQIVAAVALEPTLAVLFASVGFVLFIACANVTNLILARNESRSREMAVRLALGASRGRLVGQSLMHSGLIAAGGGALGVAIAAGLVAGFVDLNPARIPRLDAIHVDTPVMLFAAILSAATTLAVGLLPAFQSGDMVGALKLGAPGTIGGRQARRMRRALVVAEVAVSVVLIVGASLLGRSLSRLMQTDIGVKTDHVTAALIDISFGRTLSLADQRALIERVVERIRRLPAVTSAGAGASMPPNLARLRFTMNRLDDAVGQPTNYMVDAVTATPAYFSTLGIRLQKGRFFTETDDADHPQVMIMTASTARQVFGDRDPIGRTLGLPMVTGRAGGFGNAPVALVGVIDDVKYSGLESAADAVIYRPFAQQPWASMFIVARTESDVSGLALTMRKEIAAVDPAIAITSVDTLDGLVSDAAAQPRFRTVVLVSMAILAVALAGIGLYGVVAYAVARRTAEIGIRMALGAARGDVMRLVLREGMWLAAGGVVIGMVAARALTRLVAALLYGVQPNDVVSFVAAGSGLFLVAMLASYIPARRASRIDPLVALRAE